MKKGGEGGAHTQTGLKFEDKVDFLTLIQRQRNYSVDGSVVSYKGKEVCLTFKKHGSKF